VCWLQAVSVLVIPVNCMCVCVCAGGSWPLRAAAAKGHVDVCKLMISHGAGETLCVYAFV
jgi:hypothetical protein